MKTNGFTSRYNVRATVDRTKLCRLDRVHLLDSFNRFVWGAYTGLVAKADHKGEVMCCTPLFFNLRQLRWKCSLESSDDADIVQWLSANLNYTKRKTKDQRASTHTQVSKAAKQIQLFSFLQASMPTQVAQRAPQAMVYMDSLGFKPTTHGAAYSTPAAQFEQELQERISCYGD